MCFCLVYAAYLIKIMAVRLTKQTMYAMMYMYRNMYTNKFSQEVTMVNTNATSFRKDMFKLLEQTIRFNEPINISTKDGNAVVISEEDYNGLMETLYLFSMPETVLSKDLIRLYPTAYRKMRLTGSVFSKRAKDDITKLKAAGLAKKAKSLIDLLRENPYQSPPTFEKLKGDLSGALSRRINNHDVDALRILRAFYSLEFWACID